MTTDFEITDKELREVYELLTKEQLIEALIRKHKGCRDIAKNCVIPAVMGELTCDSCGCHPNVIYTTNKGRFCERCKPAS